MRKFFDLWMKGTKKKENTDVFHSDELEYENNIK